MKHYDMEMIRGDTLAFGMAITARQEDGSTTPVDPDTITFTVADSLTESGNKLVQKTMGDGIERERSGLYRLRMSPTDSAALDPGQYYYDVQLTSGGDRFTILHGVLHVYADVTK